MSLRPLRCARQAVLWPPILGRVKSKLAASALRRGAVSSLWRGVWGFDAERNNTATQQGAAPDRLQLRSFLTPLPAAGELGRCAARDYFPAGVKDFGRWKVVAFGAAVSSVFSVAAAVWLVAGVLASGLSWFQLADVGYLVLRRLKQSNTRHNKALHPTAASLVLFTAFRLCSKLVVIGRRRVSLVVLSLRAALLQLL